MSLEQLDSVISRFLSMKAGWKETTPLDQMRDDLEQFYASYPTAAGVATSVDAVGTERSSRDFAGDTKILYFHGGGFLVGSPRTVRSLATYLAAATDAEVVAIKYRLAPEHVCPAAHDDAFCAYVALLETGIAATNIVVAGDSAGGGLALALLVRVRDAGLPLPACVILISPWADLECAGSSYNLNEHLDPIANREMALGMANTYLGSYDATQPHISLTRSDLTKLPPLLVLVGDREIFLDDAKTIVRRVNEAGGNATLSLWPGMIHQFTLHVGALEESEAAVSEIADFINEHRRETVDATHDEAAKVP